MVTKTEQAITAFSNGNIKDAFRLITRFRGFSNEEKRCIQIAYECLSGKESFYISLGIDTASMIDKAIEYVSAKYNTTTKLLQR